jgi:Mce-associated membrane protein
VSTPTWYDLLDVEPSASPEEIRTAWKSAIADLDPTDRRFQRLSDAAAVLLDPERRAEYDESLSSAGAVADAQPQPADEPEPPSSRVGGNGPERSEDRIAPTRRPRRQRAKRDTPRTPRPVPAWILGVTAVIALLLVATASYSWSRPDPKSIESDAASARSAAERAVVPVLSYDYRSLDDGQQEAESWLTPTYRDKDYRPLFTTIKENAPSTQTVVTTKVVSSAIVRASQDRVEVLLLVDRPTTNKKQTTPLTYEDHVTVTMERSGDGWLIDDMST